HVPRPSNSWILFRSEYFQKHTKATQQNPKLGLDQEAAQVWNSMSEKDRRPYKELADKTKAEHEVRHPDYRYSPRRSA
ncbi:high mobility group box domain-containing protein, partial [Mycena pura]